MEPKYWVPYLEWDAIVADIPEHSGGDVDTDPETKGIHGGCTISAALTKGDRRAIRVFTEPEPKLITLGDQETRLDDGQLKLSASQQEFGLVGKSAALDIPEDVDLVYSFRFHHVTYNGKPQDLPTITVKAPVIPEDQVGKPTINLAEMEWLDQSTAVAGGYIIRQLPDDFVRVGDTIFPTNQGVPFGTGVDISDLIFQGSIDDVTDATATGKSVVRAVDAAAARAAIDAASTSDLTDLVGGAPGALDTLNELAAALNDDANFATTVTNSLAGKQDTVYQASGAAADGSTDDRAALAAADAAAVAAGRPLLLRPGVHRVATDLTINSYEVPLPGAVIKPDNGVTVTLAGGMQEVPWQVFDHSAGGIVVPANRDYRPEWWGPVKTADDSATWQACLDANAADVETVGTFNFGHRIIAPKGVNVVDELEFNYCELVAGRGWTVFTPPASSTGNVMITLGTFAEITGGRYMSSGAGQSLVWSKLGRTSLNGDVYIDPQHEDCIGWIAGHTDVGAGIFTTTPVADIVHVNSGQAQPTPPPAGSVAVEVRSPDCKVNQLWLAQTDTGLLGTEAGAMQCPNVHIWGCNNGITGEKWDKSFLAGWVETCRQWGIDVDHADHIRWDFNVWANGLDYNGTTVTDVGGARFKQTSGSARRSRISVILDDNRGKGLVLDGPDNYEVDAILSSSTVKGGGSLPADVLVGVEITSASSGTVLSLHGADAATPLTDSSTTTVYAGVDISGNSIYEFTNPRMNALYDVNGNPILNLSGVASGVDYLNINNATNGVLTISSSGTTANRRIYLRGVGTGMVGIQDASSASKVALFNVSGLTTSRTFSFPDSATTLIGTAEAAVVLNKTFTSPKITSGNAPASATATGTAGQIEWDADFLYVCVSANTWKRAALSTW